MTANFQQADFSIAFVIFSLEKVYKRAYSRLGDDQWQHIRTMSTKTKLLSTVILAGSLSLAAARDICAYTSRGCTGTFGCCSGIGEGVCCTYPANYGWSTKWQGMPLNAFWLGRTFGDFCSTSTSGAGSSTGSACE